MNRSEQTSPSGANRQHRCAACPDLIPLGEAFLRSRSLRLVAFHRHCLELQAFAHAA